LASRAKVVVTVRLVRVIELDAVISSPVV
jgi:hypothetical protein